MATDTLPSAARPIPLLKHGERLSRDEFERRYEAMPDVKAELLDGVVYIMSSPVTAFHARSHGLLIAWLVHYMAATPGVDVGDDATTRLPLGSNPQPDAYLRIEEANGGQSRIDEDGYVAGSPELLGEIAKSSLTHDRTIKKPIYQRDGVREFILWNVDDALIDWYVLRDGVYELLPVDEDDIVRSETFPGLWLDVESMARRDIGRVLRVLDQGLATPEHARFIEQLRLAAIAKTS